MCATTVPDRFRTDVVTTPGLFVGVNNLATYYFWDGYTNQDWPTHDPCGNNGTNQVANVTNPVGRLYLRRQ
jgi:hypothetical protein